MIVLFLVAWLLFFFFLEVHHLALLLGFGHFALSFGLFFGQFSLITLFLPDATEVFPIFIVFLHAKAELGSGLFV